MEDSDDPIEYCRKMAEPGEWVDHLTIQVTSEILRRKITIINSSTENRKIEINPSTQTPFFRL